MITADSVPGSIAPERFYKKLKKGVFKIINIDMWYEDKQELATRLDIYFNDLGCFYTGNIYIFGEIVGDYYADSIQEITGAFPHLAEAIDKTLN